MIYFALDCTFKPKSGLKIDCIYIVHLSSDISGHAINQAAVFVEDAAQVMRPSPIFLLVHCHCVS